MAYKIKQLNSDNNFGFQRIEEKDFGVDENGELALGYQHHDALWWPSNRLHVNKDKIVSHLDLDGTMSYFYRVFHNLALNIMTHIQPKSVLDIGCGSGQLTHILRTYGVDTVTVDANRDVVDSPYIDNNHFIARTDKPLRFVDNNNNPVVFDVVTCLEHFEHISEDSINILIQNVLDHTHKDSYFIFTAAAWKYDEDKDHIHCNVKSESAWKDYISKNGFEVIVNLFPIDRGNSAEIFCKKR